MNKDINVVFNVNSEYDKYVSVVILSLLDNIGSHKLNVYILHSEIDVSDCFTLKELEKINGQLAVNYIYVDNSVYKGLKTHDYITEHTYYRGSIPDLLPKNISKVLYLDADLLIQGNIIDLWNEDIHDFAIAGVWDEWIYNNDPEYVRNYASDIINYVNTGVLLMNLDYLRKINFTKQFIDLATSQKSNLYKHAEQCIINEICYNSIKLLPEIYNLDSSEAIIRHYKGPIKPWFNLSSDKKYMYYYRKYSEVTLETKVSVIIEYHGMDSYFESNLQTVANQIYTNIELIVLDYKNDATLNEVYIDDRLFIGIPNIKIIKTPREQDILEKIMSNANGTYITFIGRYDLLSTAYLKKLIKHAIANNSDIVLTDSVLFNEEDNLYYFHDPLSNKNNLTTEDILHLYEHSNERQAYLKGRVGKVFRAKFLESSPLHFFNNVNKQTYEISSISYVNSIEYTFRKIKQPQVSLIIPTYNRENKAGLESALQQTYQHLEIIVVHHTNETESGIGIEQNRVKCIHSTIPEEGMEQALHEASGKYIFYLDDNQTLEANCIETLVASAEQYSSDLVLTHFYTYNENDNLFYFHESGLTTGELHANDIMTLLSSSYCNKDYLEHVFGKLFAKDWLVKQQVSVYNNFLEKYGYETARLSYVHMNNFLYRVEKQELISVIVPVYNVELYLEYCLDSIVNQTYPNLEILLINDGSTDRSGKICEEYAQKDERIRVIHQKNAGLSAARNTGLDQMTGDYVTFVDSDDAINQNFIFDCYVQIKKYNIDIVMTSYYRFMQDTMEFLFHSTETTERVKFFSQDDVLRKLNKEPMTVVSWAKLFKASIFSDIRYPVGIIHEDEYIAHKLYLKTDKVLLLNHTYYMYRIREGSITTSNQVTIPKLVNPLSCFEERIVDLLLANKDVTEHLRNYKIWLTKVKHEFEVNHLCDSNEYLRIVNKLSFLD